MSDINKSLISFLLKHSQSPNCFPHPHIDWIIYPHSFSCVMLDRYFMGLLGFPMR